MIKPATLVFVFLGCLILPAYAQEGADRKAVISDKTATYTYKMNEKREIQIEAEYKIIYKCIKATSVSFVEYYDDYSEITNLKIKGAKGVRPQYGMCKRENIFFSNDKACYFQIPLISTNSEAAVTLKKTYKDVCRLLYIPLIGHYYTNSITMKIVIPDWIEVDVLEQNLPENTIKSLIRDEAKKTTTHIIQTADLPEFIIEDDAPNYKRSAPYLMVIPRESSGANGNTRYFKTMSDLYQWCSKPLTLMNNNLPQIEKKALELTVNCASDEEKIEALCKWVQQNIRYIAFLDGISGYTPDNAQDVITKKYGDCKGMSNLLKCLLISVGFDARLVWVATEDLAKDLDITNPMPFANHMICALHKNDSLHFFDPTVKSLRFGEIPENLQGQTALAEDGENYIVSKIPQHSAHYNRDSLYVQYSIAGNNLTGKAERWFRGESKHSVSYWMNSMTEAEKRQITTEFLKKGEAQDSVSNIETEGLNSSSPEIGIKYDIVRRSNISTFGDQLFINIDSNNDFQNGKIDTLKRKTAIKLPHKEYTVQVANLLIPKEYTINKVPENIEISREKYSFTISYTREGNSIIYRKEMFIFAPIIEKSEFKQWNADIEALRKAYSELIILSTE